MIPQKRPKFEYDLGTERDIYWRHFERPAFLRETVAKLAPQEHDYYPPSITSNTDIYAWALVNSPHNVPRRCRVWYLLTNTDIPDGLDIKNAPENLQASDRLIDPDSIIAGTHTKPARPKRVSRSAKRFIKKRRTYHANAKAFFENKARWPKTRWQKLKRLLGMRYA
jgi:hypothetical protein